MDAQIIACICLATMIFVPSLKRISRNPEEFTRETDLISGARIFFDAVAEAENIDDIM